MEDPIERGAAALSNEMEDPNIIGAAALLNEIEDRNAAAFLMRLTITLIEVRPLL